MKKAVMMFLPVVLFMALFLVSCQSLYSSGESAASGLVVKAVGIGNKDGAQQVPAYVHQVVMEHSRFMPATLIINKEDAVEWVNKDNESHTLNFDSILLNEHLPVGAIISASFPDPGRYWYYDQFNPGMQGMVIVR